MYAYRLPDTTHLSFVHLRVKEMARSITFYHERLGFRVINRHESTIHLSANGSVPAQLILTEQPGARPRPPRTTGLYHVAIRLPDRRALARLLRELIARGWWLQGAADHHVSEAIYLQDAESNGLELYVDRPRESWTWTDDQIDMSTEALNINGLLAAADAAGWDGIDPRTEIGHIHLNVSNLEDARAFYADLLGFDVTHQNIPGALFLSAGGYHHHLGLNIWKGRGISPPPPDAAGLIAFGIALPDDASLQTLIERVRAAGIDVEEADKRARFADPDGIGVELVIRPAAVERSSDHPVANAKK